MKWLSYLFTLISPLFLSAQGPQNRPSCENPAFDKKVANTIQFSVPPVSCETLHNWILENEDVVILDAREPKEFEVSHIKNARNIGYDKPDFDVLSEVKKDAMIVVYCSIGYRSEKIGEKLEKQGFENVYNLYGSIFEWSNKGYILVGADEQQTRQIHTYNNRWAKWVLNPEAIKIN